MNVGVIGTGSMGRNHVRVYSELKDVEAVYAFDINRENAKRMGEYGAIVSDSVDDLLNHVDAVSICVPTQYHLEIGKEVIEKGVNCLIEKPISSTVQEGEELLNLLEDKDLTVGVGHIERFNPIVEEIKRIVKNPLYVEMKRHNPTSARITDSTIVEDLMVHDIDIVFNVLFDGDYSLYSAGDVDICTTLVKFNSSIVVLSASRKASKKIRTVYIEEEDISIEGDFMNQDIYVYRKPEKYHIVDERYVQENIIEKVLVNKVEPLKEELKTFVDCVKDGQEFPITPVQALNNLRICEEIQRLNGIL
ncbi:MAG: Gfo/Idh/MocA family oxidoreductase [Euryarchaeota archaeon]|nr:Gfo/Idh/MocA family oxidoreductase [Euryarchaeota archaeon]